MADQLAELRREVHLEGERPRAGAPRHRDGAGQRRTGDRVAVAVAVEVRHVRAERVARRRALAHHGLREPPAAVVQERDHLLRLLEQQRGAERVEVAVAVDIDELEPRDAGALGADLGRAVLERPREAPAVVAQHREAGAADLVHHEVEVAVAVHVARRGHARVGDSAEEARQPDARGALEREPAALRPAVREHVERLPDVVAHRDVDVAVPVEVAERDRLRVAADAAELDVGEHGRLVEQADADPAVAHEPRDIAAPRRDHVVVAVAVDIGDLEPVDESGRTEGLQRHEPPVAGAAARHHAVVGIAPGDREVDEPVAVEVAHAEHRREERLRQLVEEIALEDERRLLAAGGGRRETQANARAQTEARGDAAREDDRNRPPHVQSLCRGRRGVTTSC